MNKEQGLLKRMEQTGKGVVALGIFVPEYAFAGACESLSHILKEERCIDWFNSIRKSSSGWTQWGLGSILNYDRLIERGKKIVERAKKEYDLKYNQ